MNQAFYRELLHTKPKLLAEIIRFNREPEPQMSGALAEAIVRHPTLATKVLERMGTQRAERDEPCWQFAEPSERLVLLPQEVLERLGRMVAAALYAERTARLLTQSDVQSIKAFLGDDIYRWSLVRGRFLVGSLSQSLIVDEPETPLIHLVRRCPMSLYLGFAAGWADPLKGRAETIFRQLSLPPAEPLVMSPEVRRQLWYFFNKLILRELDSQWTPFFD